MANRILKVFTLFLLLFISILCFSILSPKEYPVSPFQKRPSTQYWQLSTGSTIGYTKIPALKNNSVPPIIYLHGGPGGCITDGHIKQLVPFAELGHDIYLYDQVGSGHSSRLENIEGYSAERHKNDLIEIVRKIGSNKVILFGQSWGAMLAILYFTDHAENVEKIILTGPGPILPIRMELLFIAPPDSLNLKPPSISNQDGNKKASNLKSWATKKWAYISGKKLATDKEADQFMDYLNSELNKSTVCDTSNLIPAHAGNGYYSHIMTFKSFFSTKNNRPKIDQSKIPLLILRGQCDNQPWGFTQEYLELFPNCQLKVIPDAGHNIFLEQPGIFEKSIKTFLQN